MQHGFEPKPHSHTPNLTFRPKVPPSSMMASSNPTLQILLHVGFIIMLASSNHLATLMLTEESKNNARATSKLPCNLNQKNNLIN